MQDQSNIKVAIKNNPTRILFFIIMFLSLFFRALFLLTSERTMDKDECIVGIMVKGIAERGERYIHILTGDYAGGHAIIAYILAPFHRYAGNSDIYIQSLTVFVSILTVACLIILTSKLLGNTTALLAGAFLSFFPSFFKASFRVNGYIETLFLLLLSAIFLYDIVASKSCEEDGAGSKHKRAFKFALFGFFSGLSLWSFSFAIIFLAITGIVFLAHIKKFRFLEIFLSAWAFMIGYSLEINNMLHGDAVNGTIFRWSSIPTIGSYISKLCQLLTYYLPRSLSFIVYRYTNDIEPYSIGIYLIAVASFIISSVVAAYKIKKSAFAELTGLLIFLFLAVYFLLLLPLFGPFEAFPRYLLPVSIPICVIVARAATILLQNKGIMRIFGGALILSFLFFEGWGMADMSLCRNSSCPDRTQINKIVDYLEGKNIKRIHTDFVWKWQILFYSDEKVICSDVWISNKTHHNTKYDLQMVNDKNAPIVIPAESSAVHAVTYALRIRGVKHKVDRVGGLNVYHSFDKPFSLTGGSD